MMASPPFQIPPDPAEPPKLVGLKRSLSRTGPPLKRSDAMSNIFKDLNLPRKEEVFSAEAAMTVKPIYCLRALDEEYENIEEGLQAIVGRIKSAITDQISLGCLVSFYTQDGRKTRVCEVTSKEEFPSIEEMLNIKGPLHLLPHLKEIPTENQVAHVASIYRHLLYYPPGKGQQALALGIKKVAPPS